MRGPFFLLVELTLGKVANTGIFRRGGAIAAIGQLLPEFCRWNDFMK
jgi:hypothetical protein